MHLTNCFHSQPDGLFGGFPCRSISLRVTEDEAWNQLRQLQLVEAFDINGGRLYFVDESLAEAEWFGELTTGTTDSVTLSVNNFNEARVLTALTLRCLSTHLDKCGLARLSRLRYCSDDPSYVLRLVDSAATYVTYRGFAPNATPIPDSCNLEIRFTPYGAFRVETETAKWPNWVGQEVKGAFGSGLDKDRVYTLERVDLETTRGYVASGGVEQAVDLNTLYVPASPSVLKAHRCFARMHDFRNYTGENTFFEVLEGFIRLFAPDGEFRLAYSREPAVDVVYQRVVVEGVPEQW